ncbi:unannotated protein [freshwater metagenome]|uniref:Unannotated protein n=1 Tax=freshwater metagenome TaxID=449393 RepID=A0A6J7C4E7_9ZZZZ
MTTSTSERPIFPAARVRLPAASKIDSNIKVVVVFPLVPVTNSQGAGCFGSRKRQANSSSPQIGRSIFCAATTIGARGDTPGERTNKSIPSGNLLSSPRRTSAPRISNIVARSFWRSPVAASITITSDPRLTKASAAANPATPSPTTHTLTCDQSLLRFRSSKFREVMIFTAVPIRHKTMPFQLQHKALE